MSGHSKWATTKHQKAVNDARRGKEFARLIKNIEVAARTGGGDPAGNPTLYDAIQKAKKTSVPNDNIERARKRGAGEEAGGADWQTITYEGYGPNGVAVLDRMPDRQPQPRRRRGPGRDDPQRRQHGRPGFGVLSVLPQGRRHAGQERPHRGRRADRGARGRRRGCQRPGRQLRDHLRAHRSGRGAHRAAGRRDRLRLRRGGFQPSVTVPVDVDGARKVFKLVDALEDSDDVQNVYTNVDISDEVLAALDED